MRSEMQAAGLVILGLFLLLAGRYWQQDLGINRGYSDSEAREFAEAGAELHSAVHSSGHAEGDDHHGDHEDVDLEGAQKRFDAAKERRDAALNKRSFQSRALSGVGLGSLLLGLLLVWRGRQE